MRKKTILSLITASLCIVVITSCKKPTVDTNTQTATDNAICEDEFMRLLPMVNSLTQKAEGSALLYRTEGIHYPHVTVDTTGNFPHYLYIDYGTGGVVDSTDGNTRKGKITVAFTNYWLDAGTSASVTFTNYYVNGMNFVAYGNDITLFRNSDTTFTEKIGGAICKISGANLLYSANRSFRWLKGLGDSVAAHSSYIITGSGSGTDRNQVHYTLTITKSLFWSNACGYITSGTTEIVPAGLADRTVDFGNGSCDKNASVTIDGNSFTITLE